MSESAGETRGFPKVKGDLCAALADFFELIPSPDSALFAAAAACRAALPWRAAGGGKNPAVAVAELLGPDGLMPSAECRAGLFFQPAGCFYSWHRHAAEEIYLPVCGAAEWRATGRPPVRAAPLKEFIRHHPWQPHALCTTAAPLFALWTWTGDISLETYSSCSPDDALP